MASTEEHQYSDELVELICRNSNWSGTADLDEIVVLSASEIGSWDLPSILARKVVKIKASPSRLIAQSSYFRGLLRGNFSESGLSSVSIHWDMESFLSVLRAIFGCEVEISSDNFVPVNEAALFFGVDVLLSKCQVWLDELTSFRGQREPQLCLVSLIQIWKHGLEHANDFVLNSCTSYLARNFMWAISFSCYIDIPYKLFCSCIQHSDLTVDSEKHLCDAILVWLGANTANSEVWSSNHLCDEIRLCLLPLWFAAGKRRSLFFSKFAAEATRDILSLSGHPCMSLTDISGNYSSNHLKIRLTIYAQKVDVSSCPQLTTGLFLLSMIPPHDADLILRKIMKPSVNHANCIGDGFQISRALGQMLTFGSVQELDISNCPSFSLDSAIDCFSKSFPSLRSLRAAYYLNFKSIKVLRLVEKLPLLSNVDLTVDINPIIPARLSVASASSVLIPEKSTKSMERYNCYSIVSLSHRTKPWIPNIIKLTLEGRTDIIDSDLLTISQIFYSLSYVNIKGCTSVTDHGISAMILNCKKLQSVFACYTSFGNNSIQALCANNPSGTQQHENQSQLVVYKLHTLHIGGCNGVTGKALSALMSGADHLRSLCLREIQHVDDALHMFSGTSLKVLDVSDTEVSAAAMSRVILRNPGLKSLIARGCRHLVQQKSENVEWNLYSILGNLCELEKIELGWGFSFFSVEALKPAVKTLRTLYVGLGGSFTPDGLKLLPRTCPMLETLILYFQSISDSAITNIIKSFPCLESLALCYCFGEISSLSFKFEILNLRSLKLKRVTPWMTNEDLATLAENCANLVELSLIGCKFLDSRAQDIISSGWPGLESLHLEECGKITANGLKSLWECYALEDLTIRHTGRGLPLNFIIYAASKLPMLRKISLDVCDAREGDFELPLFADRCCLSTIKIARCKLQKSSVEVRNMEARKTPVHMETLVLSWNSEKLERTVIKERL